MIDQEIFDFIFTFWLFLIIYFIIVNLIKLVKCFFSLIYIYLDKKKVKNYSKLIEFVKDQTIDFDESHDLNHALRVYNYCEKIIKFDNLKVDNNIIAYGALLHDLIDYKYKCANREILVLKFIEDNLGQEYKNKIFSIINNISYSKEKAGNLEELDEYLKLHRDIISDADKIDALGFIGIERCKTFILKKIKPKDDEVEKLIVDYCKSKLINLLPIYIRTNAGKIFAQGEHDVILKYIKETEENENILS